MKMIKLIALDLDDTTLTPQGLLDDFTRDVLCEVARSGTELVVASGRAYTSLPRRVLSIPGVRYAICSNGASAVDVTAGKRIFGFTLKPESVAQILDVFAGERFECFIDGQPYCDKEYFSDPKRFGCSPAYISYVQTTRKPIDDMARFISDNHDRLDSIDVLCGSPERKTLLWEKTRELKNVYVTSSSPRLIEIADENSGKGKALKKLAEMLGIDRGDIAAFGNGDNDADMLKFAGIGVAVKNASDACKKAADMICESNADDGVAKTILRFFDGTSALQNT